MTKETVTSAVSGTIQSIRTPITFFGAVVIVSGVCLGILLKYSAPLSEEARTIAILLVVSILLSVVVVSILCFTKYLNLFSPEEAKNAARFAEQSSEDITYSNDVLSFRLPVPNATLIHDFQNPEVYILIDGIRYWVRDWDCLHARGYTMRDLVYIPVSAMNKIPRGSRQITRPEELPANPKTMGGTGGISGKNAP